VQKNAKNCKKPLFTPIKAGFSRLINSTTAFLAQYQGCPLAALKPENKDDVLSPQPTKKAEPAIRGPAEKV